MLRQIRTTRNLLIIVLLLTGIACLSSGIALLSVQCEPEEHPKLSSMLNRLVQAERRGEAEDFARPRNIELLYDDAGLVSVEVIIECLPGQVDEAAEVVGTYGTVGVVVSRGVSAIVPITSLSALANEESIESIRRPISAEGAW
jgi:hypothetical protein